MDILLVALPPVAETDKKLLNAGSTVKKNETPFILETNFGKIVDTKVIKYCSVGRGMRFEPGRAWR